jgi:6-phosphogluconolactonase
MATTMKSFTNREGLFNTDRPKGIPMKWKTIARPVILVAIFAPVSFAFQSVNIAAEGAGGGSVYVMTNQAGSNTVIEFRREKSGALTRGQEIATQGLGSGGTDDPLASQGALVMNDAGHLLLAVNAGSNDISILSITNDGMRFVERVSSGGVRPTSLAIHGDTVYVLNAGEIAKISGFTLTAEGHITPIAGSTRTLAGGNITAPSQVVFSRDGELLLVTEKATGILDIFAMGDDGLSRSQTAIRSNNATPFGVGFGKHGSMIVAEANNNLTDASSVSSYRIVDSDEGRSLRPVTNSLSASQTAACWVVISKDGHFAFVSNTTSGTISSFAIDAAGKLSVVQQAAAFLGSESVVTDMAMTQNGKFLYVLSSHLGVVTAFRVQDGELVEVTRESGLPLSIQGIVAQ